MMNNSAKEGNTSAQDPPTVSEPQHATAFERWRKRAWRAAGFGLSDDEQLESMTRNCEKQKDYLMNYSAYNVPEYQSNLIFNALNRSNRRIYAQTSQIVWM